MAGGRERPAIRKRPEASEPSEFCELREIREPQVICERRVTRELQVTCAPRVTREPRTPCTRNLLVIQHKSKSFFNTETIDSIKILY